MDIRPEILIVILGGALVTVIPRVLPLAVLSRLALPEWLREWLAHVPVAILAALLAAELALDRGALVLKPHDLIAVVPVLAIITLTRSLIGAVVAGVATMALLRAFA
jgi:branched-subunit amino acid transport protein